MLACRIIFLSDPSELGPKSCVTRCIRIQGKVRKEGIYYNPALKVVVLLNSIQNQKQYLLVLNPVLMMVKYTLRTRTRVNG